MPLFRDLSQVTLEWIRTQLEKKYRQKATSTHNVAETTIIVWTHQKDKVQKITREITMWSGYQIEKRK